MINLKYIVLAIFSLTYASKTSAQSDCNNPTPVTICPVTVLLNQTNAGMGDNAPTPCNITGEDLHYEITVVNGTTNLFISVLNATAEMYLLLEQAGCGTANCSSLLTPAGNSNLTFNVTQNVLYYLWVDADTVSEFDIEFGADTGVAWVNIPNTMGNLQFDSSPCDTPVFHSTKPFFNVTFNSVYQTDPMTLAPLFAVGTMCISTYFKNTTGDEGIKKFEFDFDPNGYSNVVTTDSIPGFYNAGYWISANLGNTWRLLFYDSAGLGRGDFTGSPDSCLHYQFCFDIIPLSNQPQLTNVKAMIYGDGFGAGFSGYVNSGCCPSPFPGCLGPLGGGGGGSGNASAFGFGFNDPGDPLPIELLSFTAEIQDKLIYLTWVTATETNNDYFTVERSQLGDNWENILRIVGSGNSSIPVTYKAVDRSPLNGISYYRLKQTDFDGNYSYSQIINAEIAHYDDMNIYPNPSKGNITLNYSSSYDADYLIKIKDSTSKLIKQKTGTFSEGLNLLKFDLNRFDRGIYFIEIITKDKIDHTYFILN